MISIANSGHLCAAKRDFFLEFRWDVAVNEQHGEVLIVKAEELRCKRVAAGVALAGIGV